MKQVIFLKAIFGLLLVIFTRNTDISAQTPGNFYSSIVTTNNGSCHAGRISGSGYFSFPLPAGLTLSQLNHLETDFAVLDIEFSSAFQIIAQSGCGLIEIWFEISGPNNGNWSNSGNVASPSSQPLGLTYCGLAPLGPLYSDIQAQYGSAMVISISLWNQDDDGDPVDFDNTIINNRTYTYDDCDGDGLLDMYDCDPANNGNNKVLVCHNGQTICVAISALQAHLNHGDYMGSCLTTRGFVNIIPEVTEGIELKVNPNPAKDNITIRNNQDKPLGVITIFDNSGKILFRSNIASSQGKIDISHFSLGVYYLRSDQTAKGVKFVKQ